jgi:hypothetical protein
VQDVILMAAGRDSQAVKVKIRRGRPHRSGGARIFGYHHIHDAGRRFSERSGRDVVLEGKDDFVAGVHTERGCLRGIAVEIAVAEVALLIDVRSELESDPQKAVIAAQVERLLHLAAGSGPSAGSGWSAVHTRGSSPYIQKRYQDKQIATHSSPFSREGGKLTGQGWWNVNRV